MPRNSQTEVVIQAVRRMISDGRLGPGSRLPVEKDLADELEVSRGSLREGIRALSALGIVETRQGAGTFVTSLAPGPLLEAMTFWVSLQAGPDAVHAHVVRRALEVEAVQLAAVRITEDELLAAEAILDRARAAVEADEHRAALEADLDFHRLVAASSGNPVLEALVNALAAPTMRRRLWQSLHQGGRLQETHRQHLAILAALRDHDIARAKAVMAAHLYAVEAELPSGGPVGEPGGSGLDPLVGSGEGDPDEVG